MQMLFLFFSALSALPKSLQNPTVTKYPNFQPVYSGDTLVLKCSGSGPLKWFFKDKHIQDQTSEAWTIYIISKKDSGLYSCERNGEKSQTVEITVLEYLPFASLSIKSGMPVINKGDSVVFELTVDTGLKDWYCHVYKGGKTKRIVIMSSLMTSNATSVHFHAKTLQDHESPAVYWCQHKTEPNRSNQITIKTTDRMVMLEPPPEPAVLGQKLILQCSVLGNPIISQAIFYKNGIEKQNTEDSALIIENVSVEDLGNYNCTATYKFKENTSNIPKTVTSDAQELRVKAQPPVAVYQKAGSSLSCSCPMCPENRSYRWYTYEEQILTTIKNHKDIDVPLSETRSYRCRATWNDGVSEMSDYFSQVGDSEGTSFVGILVAVMIMICLIIGVSCVVFFFMKKRRSKAAFQDDGGYEEVGLANLKDNLMMQEKMKGDKADEKGYEAMRASGKEEGKETEERYAALDRSKMEDKEGAYQALGREGGGGAEGGYEALDRSKMEGKEGAYQTLGREGGGGAEGGYEALDRSKMAGKEGEYQTISTEAKK